MAMMPAPWPADAESAASLMRAISREIDRRTEKDDDTLLAAFLRAAWPSVRAQDQ